ncbi:hypothetical protein HOG27_06740, partial [bacterium]|nr:hypothetical protein [bacterium]
ESDIETVHHAGVIELILAIFDVGTGVDGIELDNKTFHVEKSVQLEFSCT